MCYKKVLDPYKEAYEHTLKFLLTLENGKMYSEKELVSKLHAYGKALLEARSLNYIESSFPEMQWSALDFCVREDMLSKLDYDLYAILDSEELLVNIDSFKQERFFYRVGSSQKTKLSETYVLLKSF